MELPWVDPKDPNYDSKGRRLPRWRNKIIKLNTIVPELIEKEVGKAVEPLMLEYCKNRDCEEVLLSLEKMLMNIGARRMVPALAIELYMEPQGDDQQVSCTRRWGRTFSWRTSHNSFLL